MDILPANPNWAYHRLMDSLSWANVSKISITKNYTDLETYLVKLKKAVIVFMAVIVPIHNPEAKRRRKTNVVVVPALGDF